MTSTATTTTLRSPLTCLRHNHHARSPPTAPLLLEFHHALSVAAPQLHNSSTEKPAAQQLKPPQSRSDRNVAQEEEEAEEPREPQLRPEEGIRSIFRTSAALDDNDPQLKDLWTLKRANPVTEAIQEEEVLAEEEESYESPSKRQCSHLDWDQALPTDAPLVLVPRSSRSSELVLESL